MLRALNLRKLNKLCNFTYSKCVITLQRTLLTSPTQNAKLFVDRENTYCYGIIAPLFDTQKVFPEKNEQNEEMTTEWFNNTLNHHFRKSTATEIVSTFKKVVPFCIKHNITISDTRFDALVDGLMDHAEKLTDNELLTLLDVLNDYPTVDSINAHNYHDVWSCLDDISGRRIGIWKPDMLITVAEKWYKLGLGRVGDFTFNAIDKMSKKPEHRLTKDQLVHVFFLMNVSRKRLMHFEYEHALYLKVEEMTVDELAIVALGYFKTQTKVKIPQILAEMLRKAKNAEDIHEMTLCGILKTVRYTSHPSLADQMLDFMEHITPKLPYLSTLCVLHAALLGTTLQILHKPSLSIAAQRIASNISNVEMVRLKDIERLLLTLTMLDYDPQTTPCIFKACMAELHEERRNTEIIRYRKCLGAALSFLSIKNMYSIDLLKQVLDPELIEEVYGKSAKMFPRELFVLNMNTYLEVPEYNGPRLSKIKQIKCAKWLTTFTPVKEQTKRVTAMDKLILDVHGVLENIVGGPENMFIEHLLPQYLRADVVICRDKLSKKFIKPQGFDKYEFGELIPAPKDENKDYFAIVILGWNATVRGSSHPVGLAHMKLRHLKILGYKPFFVIWNEFSPLTKEDKHRYIENKIQQYS